MIKSEYFMIKGRFLKRKFNELLTFDEEFLKNYFKPGYKSEKWDYIVKNWKVLYRTEKSIINLNNI